MTENKPTRATFEQRKIAVQALVGGATVGDAAAAAGVSRQTVTNWKREDQVFLDLYEKAQGKLADRIVNKAAQAALHAVETLDLAVVGSIDDKTRIDAAKFIVNNIFSKVELHPKDEGDWEEGEWEEAEDE